jgi:hypothetical protein
MRTTTLLVAVLLAACGTATTTETATTTTATNADLTSGAMAANMVDIENGELPDDWTASLHDAPWSVEAPPAEDGVSREVVAAWQEADNREWCAPLVPSAGVEGARARRAEYAGGWAVEFDKRGMPGVARNGRACTNCGRATFGIAGTALSVDDEDPMEAEELTLTDGSQVRYEPSMDEEDTDDGAAGHVATIKIRGQNCVYQVWSFAGDEHLGELVRGLRFTRPAE